jgi:hypothetical protein
MGIERRNHESGTGHGDDQIDVRRREAGTRQAFLGRLATQFNRVFHVLFICLREGSRFDSVFDGENGLTIVNARIVHNAHHGLEIALGNIKHPAHVIFHIVASDGVGRKRGRSCGNGAVFRTRALLFGVRKVQRIPCIYSVARIVTESSHRLDANLGCCTLWHGWVQAVDCTSIQAKTNSQNRQRGHSVLMPQIRN